MNKQTIKNAIAVQWEGDCEIELFDELPSTNQYLTRRVQDDPALPTIVCIAQHQTAGVGRRGKVWHSPIDSITFSIHRRFSQPPATLMGLSLVTGIAVTDVLMAELGVPLSLKWPNDILIDQRKLAGILIEMPRSDAQTTSTVTGIGINVSQGEVLDKVEQPYSVLSELTSELPPRDQLIGTIAGTVLSHYTRFEQQGWSVFAETWQQRDYLSEKPVDVIGESHRAHGQAVGVAADGGLKVKINGQEQIFYSGEVSVRAINNAQIQ